MKHFTERELRCRCCGQLPPQARENIEALVDNVLDPAREAFGGPIYVNSGYRCPPHHHTQSTVRKQPNQIKKGEQDENN